MRVFVHYVIIGYLSTTTIRNEMIYKLCYNNGPKLDHVYICGFGTCGNYYLHTVKIPSYFSGASLRSEVSHAE